MTLKRQSVQRLSDHKTVRTFCVNQEYGIVERMVWSKTNGRSLLSGAEKGWGGGGRVSETGVRTEKYDSKNTIETDNEKIKERKQERKK